VRAYHITYLLILAVLATAGCRRDRERWIEPATTVHVQEAADGQPVAGVKIVVMANHDNTPLAEPLLSDENGICDFGVLPSVDSTVLAFGGGRWRVFGATGYYSEKDAADPLTPPTPPVSAPPLVTVTPILPPGGVHVSGTVVDAETDTPLATVFISATPYPTGYVGATGPSDDVTLTGGAFGVSEIVFAQDPVSGRPFQVVPLFVTRHGYLPQAWRYQARPGEIIGEITNVRIALQRDDGAGRGSLTGRLMRLGEPAPYVKVGLGAAGQGIDKGGAGMTGWTARSDADGVFRFDALPAGRYMLHPGFLPGDGAYYPDQAANFPRVVEIDAETDAGDLLLVWELEPLSPPSGARVPADTPDFRWGAAPDAASYDFYLDRRATVTVGEPRYVLPDGESLAPGNHAWSVIAYDAEGLAIGTFGRTAEFHVLQDAEPTGFRRGVREQYDGGKF